VNVLVEDLPEAVEIDGREYLIRSDHRTCIRVILAFEDDGLTMQEKRALLLANLYPEIPTNTERAYAQGVKFLDGGESEGDDVDSEPALRVYSFSQDAGFIFAAFRQTHGIDLEAETLHWWKFLALFSDLGAETTFCQLAGLRKRVRTGKATKEEKQAARELGKVFEVPEPDTRTLEEREQEREFLSRFEDGERRRERVTQ
jgi:hypothetical protein